MSCDAVRYNANNIFHNLLNNANVNMTYCNAPLRVNSIDYCRRNDEYDSGTLKEKCENTVIDNANIKSPEMSLTNNLQSPYSYRIDMGENSIFHNRLSDLHLSENFINQNFNITSFESFLGEKKLEEMDKNEMISLLKCRFDKLKEEEAKIKAQCEILNKNSEKLQQKEGILQKEKDKLEAHFRIHKSNKTEFENKTSSFQQNCSKFENELTIFQYEKEIVNHEKNVFTNVTFMMTSGSHLLNSFADEDKILDAFHKLPCLPNQMQMQVQMCTTSTAVESFANVYNKKKTSPIVYNNPTSKEIVIETPSSYLHRESLKTAETSEHAAQKGSLNVSHNNGSKFYTPIAQIDLLNKKKSPENILVNTNPGTGDMVSPKCDRKSPFESNKLIDSLESLAQINPRPLNTKINEINKKNPYHRTASTENEAKQAMNKEEQSLIKKYSAKMNSVIQKSEVKKGQKAPEKGIKKDNSAVVLKSNENAHKLPYPRIPSKQGKL